jgi:DegV family protein with EDD domain
MGFGNIKIVTDTGCDLDSSMTQPLGITVLPLGVSIDGKEYLDRVDIMPAELAARMENEGIVPKTFQVPLSSIQTTFRNIIDAGDIPIYVCFSSRLSGTYQSALIATQEADGARVIDSKAASVGQGLLALKAQELVNAGASPDEIVKQIESMSKHMEHLFFVNSLVYLRRGGRISHTKAIVGTLLNIKPILHFIDGTIYPLENARSFKKAISRLLDLMEARGTDLKSQTIGISYAGNAETALTLKSQITERFGCTNFVISEIGAVICSHAGPGTCALFFLGPQQGGKQAKA